MTVENINFEIYLTSYPHLLYSYIFFYLLKKNHVFLLAPSMK